MLSERDEQVLARAKRVGLRRGPFYNYVTWVGLLAAVPLTVFGIGLLLELQLFAEPSDQVVLPVVLSTVLILLLDPVVGWFLARRWGVPGVVRPRVRRAEEASDRRDPQAVVDLLDPIRHLIGGAEMLLLARARTALKRDAQNDNR